MSRLDGWPERLHAMIDYHDKPFAWGESDCMQLAMDVCEALTGQHPYPDTRPNGKGPRYKSRVGALNCLREYGFGTIFEALAVKYKTIPVALAQRGDIGIVKVKDSLSACICEGVNFVGKAPGNDGLIRFKRNLVLQAFRVN